MQMRFARSTQSFSILATSFDRWCGPPCAVSVSLLGVFVTAAYLSFANLDYAGLWYDEARTATQGKVLLEQGHLRGFDGRNMMGADNGRELNADLIDVWPPLAYALNAVGIALFGFNEIGARVMHALVGVASLVFFYFLLREHLRRYPRLIFFIFLFAAWSAQLLLYFRSSRYYAFMVLGVIAAFYLYERYWRTKRVVFLFMSTLVAALSFFNHYIGGAATMLSLAAWHLLFRARETTAREYLLFGVGCVAVVVLGSGYLVWLGVLGGERASWADFWSTTVHPYTGAVPAPLLRLHVYTRDLFTADWISWPVCLWFIGTVLMVWKRQSAQPGTGRVGAAGVEADHPPVVAVGKIVVMGLLFTLFSALLSVQPVSVNSTADLRYYVGALPLLLAMKGLFVEWTWRKSKIAGTTMAALLLLTSTGAWPFNMVMEDTGKRTLGAHLFQFVREIHRPYPDAVRLVSRFLLEHADHDDLVFVPKFEYREPLTFYAGHHVRFCCLLDEFSPLPRRKVEALGAPLYVGEQDPDWIVLFDDFPKERWQNVGASFEVVATPAVHHRLTQRPELNYHAFAPLPPDSGVHVLRRKTELRGSPHRGRRHSALDYLSPAAFERAAERETAWRSPPRLRYSALADAGLNEHLP